MPIALLAALAVSTLIHLVGLFGADLDLAGGRQVLRPLQAEIRPLPQVVPAQTVKPKMKLAPVAKKKVRKVEVSAPTQPIQAVAPVAPEPLPEFVPDSSSTAGGTLPAPSPVNPVLPTSGTIRFAISKVSLAMRVGQAEHRWDFSEDGRYRLTSVTETSGLVGLLRPVRLQVESSGRMVASGLQPETLRTLRDGEETDENADFLWSTAEVILSRDGSIRSIARGTQDILSLNYQLAYLPNLDEGASIGVVTGKKYERYALDSLGEEEINTPAGQFRTLHLRAMTDSVTEIWIALDRGRLPVKIRFTDKKGESFEQVATEIGMP